MQTSDWLTLLTTFITVLVPTGGLTAIVTLRDKKTAAVLDNIKTVVDQWQEIAGDRKTRAEELKVDLDRKEDIIQKQWVEISDLRNQLDHERTARAVAEMLKCRKTDCTDREPPFGEGVNVDCQIKK